MLYLSTALCSLPSVDLFELMKRFEPYMHPGKVLFVCLFWVTYCLFLLIKHFSALNLGNYAYSSPKHFSLFHFAYMIIL